MTTATQSGGDAAGAAPNGSAVAATAAPAGPPGTGAKPAAIKAESGTGAEAAAAARPEDAAAVAAADGPPDAEAAAAAAAARAADDAVAARGAEIAGLRALLAAGHARPAEGPARPRGHWGFLLEEAAWLANDVAQERLWKRAAALALAYNVARARGEHGLKPPPKGARVFSDEVRELRAAAAKAGAERAGGGGSARRGRASAAPTPAASAGGGGYSDDPAVRALEGAEARALRAAVAAAAAGLASTADGPAAVGGASAAAADPAAADAPPAAPRPGTPPPLDLAAALAYSVDVERLSAELNAKLLAADAARLLNEEIAARAHRMEFEASALSHRYALAEAARRAAAAGELGLGLGAAGGDAAADAARRAGARRKAGRAAGAGAGFLGLDDFEYGDAGDADAGGLAALGGAGGALGGGGGRRAGRAALVEDVYLRKRRPQRAPSYRADDADYEAALEGGARYGTRRATGAARAAGAPGAPGGRAGAPAGGRRPGGAPGARGADAYAAQQQARARAAAGAGMVLWAKAEDELLLAVVHEFGPNWTLVSEVLSLSLALQGVHRSPAQCRQRFRQAAAGEGGDYSEERACAALAARLPKAATRELLVSALPVRDETLVRLLEHLVQVGTSAKGRRAMEERRQEPLRARRQAPHATHEALRAQLLASTGGRAPSPLELAAHVTHTYMAQARQQAAMAAQAAAAQAAHHAAAQQQAAAAGGGGAPPAQSQAAAPPAPAQPQQPGAALPVAPAPPPPQPQPGAPPPGARGPSQPPAVSIAQLDQILAAGRLPNGQELTPQMRAAIENKREGLRAHVARAAAAAAAAAAGGGGAAAPGGAAMQAAMQAAQQAGAAAALAAGAQQPAPGAAAAALAAQLLQQQQQSAAVAAAQQAAAQAGQ